MNCCRSSAPGRQEGDGEALERYKPCHWPPRRCQGGDERRHAQAGHQQSVDQPGSAQGQATAAPTRMQRPRAAGANMSRMTIARTPR